MSLYISPRMLLSAASAVALLAAMAAGPSHAADPSSYRHVQLGPRTIAVPVPAGYCPIDRSIPAQDVIAAQVEAVSGDQVQMLTLDSECSALEAFTAKGGGSITPYVIHYAVLEGGKLATYGGTRAAFVEETARELEGPELRTKLDETAREVDAAAQQKLDELARKSQAASVTVEGTQVQEPLGRDDNAVYLGFISRFETAEGPRATAGVTGITLIDGVVTTVNMYRDYQDQQTLETLLKETQGQVAAVIAANGG